MAQELTVLYPITQTCPRNGLHLKHMGHHLLQLKHMGHNFPEKTRVQKCHPRRVVTQCGTLLPSVI